jgi:hypothetical protein
MSFFIRCALVAFVEEISVKRAVSRMHQSLLCRRALVIRPDLDNKTARNEADTGIDIKSNWNVTASLPAGVTAAVSQSRADSGDSNAHCLRAIVNRSQNVFVGNLSVDLDAAGLRGYFERYHLSLSVCLSVSFSFFLFLFVSVCLFICVCKYMCLCLCLCVVAFA